MEHFAISVDGTDDNADLEALTRWFADEPDLRGLVKPAPAVPSQHELGAVTDILMATFGAGGAGAVFAGSLKTFFAQPRGAKVRLVWTRPDGTKLELDADRVKRFSVTELTEQMLEASQAAALGATQEAAAIEPPGDN